jgi:hypothetical protein
VVPRAHQKGGPDARRFDKPRLPGRSQVRPSLEDYFFFLAFDFLAFFAVFFAFFAIASSYVG